MKKNQTVENTKKQTRNNNVLEEIDFSNQQNNKKRLIVVLGMHRSGTSAITHGLQVLGVDLGTSLIPAKEDNETGFWEDEEITELNIDILNAINNDWCSLTTIQIKDLELLREQGYFLKAVGLLRQKTANINIFGFKDPRTAKLLIFWQEVFSHLNWDISYVLAIRNPLSVTKSLAKRNGLEVEKSYLLWLEHILISLINTSDENRVLVDYDALMQSPDSEIQRIADTLNLTIDTKKLDIYKNQFLDTNLRHSVYDANDLLYDNDCPKLVQEIYSFLSNITFGKINIDELDLTNKLKNWHDEFERFSFPFKLIDKQTKQITNLNQFLIERDQQIAHLNWIISKHEEHIDEFNQAINQYNEQTNELNRVLINRDEQINELNQVLINRDEQINELNQILINRDEQINELNQILNVNDAQFNLILNESDKRISDFEQHITNLNQIIFERDKQIAAYSMQSDILTQTISELKNSTSWKLTAPLRLFISFFKA